MSDTKAEQKDDSTKEQQPKKERSVKKESSTEGSTSDKKNTGDKTKKNPEMPAEGPEHLKIPVKQGVTGIVKWFNVVNRYGFINRADNDEDIFVHQTAIAKNNPKKVVASLGDGEEVLFDVVEGLHGPEAANVTGPNGEPVQGSKHAPDKLQRSNYGRGQFRRGYQRRTDGNSGGEENEDGDDGAQHSAPRPRGLSRGGRGQLRGRGFRGGFRGRRNFRSSNSYGGGDDGHVYENLPTGDAVTRPRGRGRGGFRGRGRGGGGGRGRGAPRYQYE